MDLGIRVSRQSLRGGLGSGHRWVRSGLVAWALPVALAGPGDSFDTVLVWGCAGAVAAATCWLWVVTTVVTSDALRGLARPVGASRRGSGPRSSCSAEPRSPAGWPPRPWRRARDRQARRCSPGCGSRSASPSAPAAVAPSPSRSVAGRAAAVRRSGSPGDTLWDIAARRLGAGASWPAIYALNRDVIGPDPGVITPGQRLVLPSEAAGGAR